MVKKLESHEAMDAVERMALSDAAERVAQLSREEVDRKLAAKGFDPVAARARGAAFAASLARKHSRPKRAPMWTWVGGALAAAAAVVLILRIPRDTPRDEAWSLVRERKPVRFETPDAGATELAIRPTESGDRDHVYGVGFHEFSSAAQALRAALADCQAARYAECRRKLIAAHGMDPSSDTSDAAREVRSILSHAAGESQPSAP